MTLDDDVAAAVERRRADRGTRLRDEINSLLRAGLAAIDADAIEAGAYELPTYDPGRQLIDDSKLLAGLLDAEDVERGLTPQS